MAEVYKLGIIEEEEKKRQQLIKTLGGVNIDLKWIKFIKLAYYI